MCDLAVELDILNIWYLKIWEVYKPKNEFLYQQNGTGLLYMMQCGLTVRIKGDSVSTAASGEAKQ